MSIPSSQHLSVDFVIEGQTHTLDSVTVENRLADVHPEAIRKHAVKINGRWFPVIQAFEAATGLSRSDFKSGTARRHLSALGYEVERFETAAVGNVDRLEAWVPIKMMSHTDTDSNESWHTEANIQAAIVTWLVGHGWRILSVANTATKAHGIDVVGERGGDRVGVEVKGFPSRSYADPARAEEKKRTSPSTQAAHWYSQAILAAMRLRGKQPDVHSVIALPDMRRYRDLLAETRVPLRSAGITVWLVDISNEVIEVGPYSAL